MSKKIKKENRYFIFDNPLELNFKYFIKRIVLFFVDIFYNLILSANNKKVKKPKKYYTSICGIFKNEALYMKEWIEYHKMIGIEHFYLYNNFSDDNYEEILSPYIKAGVVTLKDWPVKAGQISAYKDCYENYKLESHWICFLDFDEFICPYEEKQISNWLKNFEKYPSIVIYWKMFGTSGKIKREKKLVTEEFYVSWKKLVDIGKVFINTKFEFEKIYHHHIQSKTNIFSKEFFIPSVNEYGKFICFGLNRGSFLKKTTIQINHYWSKTYEEYIRKKIPRGDVFFLDREYDLEAFYYHENKNISSDYKIFRFLIQLKENMRLFKVGDLEDEN